MEQHVNTLLSVYGEDLNRLRNRVGKDRSENTFRAMNMGRDYVERFLKERYGLDDIPIERLTPQFIQELAISHGIPLQVSILPRTYVPENILRRKNLNGSSPIVLINRS